MDCKKRIEKILSKVKEDNLEGNADLIEIAFGDLKYTSDDYDENLLHIFVDSHYNEDKCLIAIRSLLKAGLNPNHIDTCEYNFIQTAIDTGYSEKFIYACINEALKYGLDVNHKEEDGDTIIHTAINADDYKDNFLHILELLCDNGYNIYAKNKRGKTIEDLVFSNTKYTNNAKRQLIIGMDKYLTTKKR